MAPANDRASAPTGQALNRAVGARTGSGPRSRAPSLGGFAVAPLLAALGAGDGARRIAAHRRGPGAGLWRFGVGSAGWPAGRPATRSRLAFFAPLVSGRRRPALLDSTAGSVERPTDSRRGLGRPPAGLAGTAIGSDGPPRWVAASYSRIEPATEALSEPTAPRIGIRTSRSQRRRTAGPSPWPSLPTTRAIGPRRSASRTRERGIGLGADDPEPARRGGRPGRRRGRRPARAAGARRPQPRP